MNAANTMSAQPAGGIGQNHVMGQPGMGFSNGNNANSGKKAVHVKWAGKTIALGTFPQAEADEKCARAKALTRAWRSTMRPKPNREWVMLELERLQVRVVSGRLGRGSGDGSDDGCDDDDSSTKEKIGNGPKSHKIEDMENAAGTPGDALGRRDSITASILSAADVAKGDRTNSLEWASTDPNDFKGDTMARRTSSLGMSLLGGDDKSRNRVGLGGDKKDGLLDSTSPDPSIPPHRPLVGGGSAAAYEAARADHYNRKQAENQNKARTNGGPGHLDLQQQQRRFSGLARTSLGGVSSTFGNGPPPGAGGLLGAANQMAVGGGGALPQLGLAVNPNQHYEMLKLHHMNLLNEIQETTLMMNLYQQQQLQQQQQQLQQQDSQSLLAQQANASSGGLQGLDSLYGTGGANDLSGFSPQQGLGGLGGGPGLGGLGAGGGAGSHMDTLMRQQNMLQGGGMVGLGGDSGSGLGSLGQGRMGNSNQQDESNGENEELRQARLKQLKEDIAERQRQAELLEAAVGGKRKLKDESIDEAELLKRRKN